MKFKSALITQASGSIGGATFGSNKGGLFVRSRAIPTNPNTQAQQAARNAMRDAVGRWTTTLTQAQRDAWATYAQNTPVVDVFGDSKLRSGQQMYIRSNAPRIRFGITPVDDAPSTFNLGSFTPITITIASGTPAIVTVTFTDTDAWAIADQGFMIITTSKQQNPSKEFFKAPFLFASSIVGAVVPPTSPAAINSKFAGAVNNKMFVKATVALPDGRYTTAQIISAIMT